MADDKWGSIPIPAKVAERAYTSAVFDGNCWISTYSVASHGYAQIGWNADGRVIGTTAHRAAWVHVHGQIPIGLTVDHVCHVRRCVTVDHLRLLTNSENGRRNRPDYDDDFCRRGHPRSVNTMVVTKDGGRIARQCRICYEDATEASRLRAKKRRELQSEAADIMREVEP